jgi:hypothetical protein
VITAIRRNTSSLIGEVSKPPQVALTSNGKPEARFQELVKECGKLKKAALLREFIFAEKDALEAAKGGGDGTPTAKLSGVEMRKLLNRVAISGNAPQDVHQLIEACLELDDRTMTEFIEELGKVLRGRVLQEYVKGTLRVSRGWHTIRVALCHASSSCVSPFRASFSSQDSTGMATRSFEG